MNSNKKYGYLVRNTMLFTISSFGSKVLSFLLVPFYTSVLSTADYGKADILTTTAGLLIFVFTLNISDAVLRFAIDQCERQEEILLYGIKVLLKGSVLLGAVLLLCWKLIPAKWESYCYVFLFFNFFNSSLNQIICNYLRAIDRIRAVAISGIITTFFIVTSNILLLLVIKIGLAGYLLSFIIASLASIIYGLLQIWSFHGKIVFSCCSPKMQREMKHYSIPLIFNGIAWWANNGIDKYFISGIIGVANNGVYAVAYKIPTILSAFSGIFVQAWNLSALKEYEKSDNDHFFANMYSAYSTGMVVICSALILINIPLSRLLFSKDFFAAWRCSSTLLLSMIFSGLSSFVGSVFSAVKANKICAVSTISGAVVNIVLNSVMISKWGTQGAAIATAISFMTIWLVRMIYVRKYIDWKLNMKTDIMAYMLLIIQIVFEHSRGHAYPGQILAFSSIVILYRSQILRMFQNMKK